MKRRAFERWIDSEFKRIKKLNDIEEKLIERNLGDSFTQEFLCGRMKELNRVLYAYVKFMHT